jgi:hypothetical protein
VTLATDQSLIMTRHSGVATACVSSAHRSHGAGELTRATKLVVLSYWS